MASDYGSSTALDYHNDGVPFLTSHTQISDETCQIFQWIFYTVLSEFLCSSGSVANITNIICFLKLGFKDTVNISLFGLALSDLGCLVSLLWTVTCYNPAFNNLNLDFEPIEVQYLTGAAPHVIFSRVTSCITAFIALERCLCITLPLKVKSLFTRKRVTTIIVLIFVFLTCNGLPLYYANRLAFKFSSFRNKTIFGLVYTNDREIIDAVVFATSGVFVQFGAFLTVVVCTVTLVVKLQVKEKWRQKSTSAGQSENTSIRDQKVTKMVVVISTIFIACYIPLCFILIGMIVEPEFSIEGNYRNLFIVVSSMSFTLESVNSAMNIFIYYHMSSKYKNVLRLVCARA